jgi:hypothetical protein
MSDADKNLKNKFQVLGLNLSGALWIILIMTDAYGIKCYGIKATV